jgi:heat-inducible transcriptional repressor
MRVLSENVSKGRKKRILQAAISHYIKTNKPVSSRIISSNYGIKLSSATVRNLISALEKEGLLKHSHASSGCIPTDKGYRHFVDSLMELQDLAINERRKIMDEFRTHMSEIDELLMYSSHLLSVVSNCVGFAMEPKLENSQLKNQIGRAHV